MSERVLVAKTIVSSIVGLLIQLGCATKWHGYGEIILILNRVVEEIEREENDVA